MKPTALSNIMCMAWRFYRTTRQAFGECLKLAWRNFCLVRKMHTEVVRFYFRKGTAPCVKRGARCALT